MIRPVAVNDAEEICGIYNFYIANTVISFEEQSVSIDEMKKRITDITAKYPWFVFEEGGNILGYAYAGEYRSRCAYRYTAEITIYIKNGEEGRGLGSQLMRRIIEEAPKCGVHTLISAIALPNDRSVMLHEKFGFEKIGHFKEVGFKFERWIDVGYWELELKK